MSAPSITLSPGGGFLLEPTGSVTIFTPEMLSEEQRMMKETADDFIMKEVMPRVADIESKKPGVMRGLMQKAGSVGLLGHLRHREEVVGRNRLAEVISFWFSLKPAA